MDPTECSGHSHDHDHGDELGLSLRPQIDQPKVFCLNEEVANAGRSILKIHEERLSATPSLTSPDDDPELLLVIPFTESVTLQSISIRSLTSENTAPPKNIKIFANRDDLDFEMAREMPPDMKLELLPTYHFVEGSIDYPCRPAGRFQNISSVTIFVQDNYDESGEQPTEITFVGLKGKGTKMKRMAVETVYETKGMMKDHKVPKGELGANHFIG
eukprot:CAMPEP_0119003136 /NCGR_PEP_ID=MMETSP1176-20130426/375_1 /TAXON_ID=265551 /ORGANISM="Synedropsis recta cf, Strain CCMP1620" /LENGTH=214 /DNA_ID=CAMNT_0006954705 /DNA_START=50 /DNA_END=694 /DNA_ORIENTATION=-